MMRSFPLFMQSDAMLCGATCIRMICKYHGRMVSKSMVEDICTPSAEGVSMLCMKKVSEQLGFEVVCGRVGIDELYKTSAPCILHWNQNHFVVLYKIKKEKFYIADPGKGLLTYKLDEFKAHWIGNTIDSEKGISMFLSPTATFFERAKIQKQETDRSFRHLFKYIRQYRGCFSQIFLGLFVGSLLQLLLPFLMQNIVDAGIKNKDINLIWLILIGQLIITLSSTSMDFIRRWLLLHISMRINISLLSDFFIKLLKLPMSFFDTKQMGDLLQRMGDHSRVNAFLTQQALGVLFSLISFFVFGTVLFIYNRYVFLIFLFGSILYGIWIALFLHRRKVLDYELFEQYSINSNKTYQFITSMQEIKLQDCENRRRWEWEDVQADLFKLQTKTLKLQQMQEAGSIFVNELKNIVITVVSATAVIHGDITLGMMLAIQYIIGQLQGPIEEIMDFVYSLQDVQISLERINEIHQKDNEEDSKRILTHFATQNHDIKLNAVDFKYDRYALRKTIDNLNVHIPEGKITAIVGSSGSGKTTLVKLLLGYYHVLKGSIEIAGQNLDSYNLKWWRRQCGVVMQDGVIFSESIARNIAVDDGEINDDRLKKAAEIANVTDFIESLPLKFSTKIGHDGMGLSQGQKQRILIARAVYKNPDYIFLDEATNSLDAENERIIVDNLNRFYQGRTVIVVAHRLSTVKNADQIIVLNGGKVVETGNHDSLIAAHGAYYNLVSNQLELGN